METIVGDGFMSEYKKASPDNTTVIICCAGMGTRLGIGTTKALVDTCGVPLIIRELQLLNDFDDIRIVVGYQAEKLLQIVNSYRSDIMYVFNYQYETTGVADSLRKALLGAREYVICLDGDTLINPTDFKLFVNSENECIAVSSITSAEPIKAVVKNNKVEKLSKNFGTMQWSGIAKVQSCKLSETSSHVYDLLNEILPMDYVKIDTREIDTPEDYENAIEWMKTIL